MKTFYYKILFLVNILFTANVFAYYPAGDITYRIRGEMDPQIKAGIERAMDEAIIFHKKYVGAAVHINVYYDENSPYKASGTTDNRIVFGPDRQYHRTGIALHEISHVLGIGLDSKFDTVKLGNVSKRFKKNISILPSDAIHKLKEYSKKPGAKPIYSKKGIRFSRAGNHFSPFGLNGQGEYTRYKEAVFVLHCTAVKSFLQVMGKVPIPD